MYELIDSLQQTLARNGTATAKLDEFGQANTNAKKVELTQRWLDDLKLHVPAIASNVKDNNKSIVFRTSGDKWLSRGTVNLFDALVNYNEAICFGEKSSDALAMAYAQRSGVYYAWGKHQLCLDNIELARSTGSCRSDLIELLNRREIKCIENLKLDDIAPVEELVFEPQLSRPGHSKVPYVADCLDIRENEQYGRYIITHADLEPGETLVIEERYLHVLLPKLRYQRCTHCMRECSLSLIPCGACTAAMFCSSKCYNTAQSTYHPYECSIIDFLHEHCDRFHLCAVRATIMAFTSYKSVEQLREALAVADRSAPVTAFTVNHRKRMVPQKYLQIHTFPTKQELRSVEDLLGTATVTAVLSRRMLTRTQFADMLHTEAERSLLVELLFKHLQIARMYYHSFSSADRQYRSSSGQGGLRGSGAFPFCSLINHACTPNILRVPFGTKMVVFALRKIRAGEQLFDNYG